MGDLHGHIQTDLAVLTGRSARIEEEIQDDLPDGRGRKTCQACQSRFDIPMQPLRTAGNLGLEQQLEVFKVFRTQSLANAVKAVRTLLGTLKAQETGGAGAPEAMGKLAELATLARGVHADAKAAGFGDVAREAESLEQQLDAVVRKAEVLDKKIPQA